MKAREMQNGEERAGWRVEAWAKAIGISRAQVWVMIKRGDLKTVKLGKIRIIVEQPRDFLERQPAD